MTRLTPELEQQLREAIKPKYQDMVGTASYERKTLLNEIDRLRKEVDLYRKNAELWSEHVEALKSSVGLDVINVHVFAQRIDGSIYAIHHAIRPCEYINDDEVAERVGQRLSREILAAIAVAKGRP